MFLRGATHAPEWRLASFIHVLRWWWRALALPRLGNDIRAVKYNEAILFGRHEKGFGAGRVRFRDLSHEIEYATDYPEPWNGDGNPNFTDWSGLAYLRGPGVKERTQTLPRNAIRVEARVRWDGRNISGVNKDKCMEILHDALLIVGLLGGLGARSRRGFGSLSLRSLTIGNNENHGPQDVASYKTLVKEIVSRNGKTLDDNPPYTAFGSKTRIAIVATGHDPRALLNDLGWAFQYYRSWGQNADGGRHFLTFKGGTKQLKHDAGNRSGSFKFTSDHAWYEDVGGNNCSPAPAHLAMHPKRVVFGLPLNHPQKPRKSAEIAPTPESKYGRRASPLFFHIQQLSKNSFIGVLTLLQANFLPNGVNVRTKRGLAPRRSLACPNPVAEFSVPPTPDWTAVTEFIEYTGKQEHLQHLGRQARDADADYIVK